MKPAELIEACTKAVNEGCKSVILVIPRISRGERIRLTPKRGPLGDILSVNRKGETVARFDAKDVLKFAFKLRLHEISKQEIK